MASRAARRIAPRAFGTAAAIEDAADGAGERPFGEPLVADVGVEGDAGLASVGGAVVEHRGNDAEGIEGEQTVGAKALQGVAIARSRRDGRGDAAQPIPLIPTKEIRKGAEDAEADVDQMTAVGGGVEVAAVAVGTLDAVGVRGQDEDFMAAAAQLAHHHGGAQLVAADEKRGEQVRKDDELHALPWERHRGEPDELMDPYFSTGRIYQGSGGEVKGGNTILLPAPPYSGERGRG